MPNVSPCLPRFATFCTLLSGAPLLPRRYIGLEYTHVKGATSRQPINGHDISPSSGRRKGSEGGSTQRLRQCGMQRHLLSPGQLITWYYRQPPSIASSRGCAAEMLTGINLPVPTAGQAAKLGGCLEGELPPYGSRSMCAVLCVPFYVCRFVCAVLCSLCIRCVILRRVYGMECPVESVPVRSELD